MGFGLWSYGLGCKVCYLGFWAEGLGFRNSAE